MDIKSYIIETLKHQGKLGLGPYGTLYVQHSPGQLNRESQRFNPPKTHIAYDAQAFNETALAAYLTEVKGLTAEEVSQQSNMLQQTIEQALNNPEGLDIEGIGHLYLAEDKLTFEASENTVLNAAHFGLPQIQLDQYYSEAQAAASVPEEPVAEAELKASDTIEDAELQDEPNTEFDEQETFEEIQEVPHLDLEQSPESHAEMLPPFIEEEVPEVEQTEVLSPQAEKAPENVQPATATAESTYEIEEPEPRSFFWLILVALILLAGLAYGLYLWKPELFNQFKNAKANTVETVQPTEQINPALTDSLQQDSLAQLAQQTDTLQKTAAAKISYHIIAASFQTTRRAEIMVKDMKALGLDAKIVELPGRLKKVSIASFKTESEALAQRPLLEEKTKLKNFDIIQITDTP